MPDPKELKPEELIREMIKSPGWQLYEDEINNTIKALEEKADTDDFESLSDMEKVRSEKRGLKRALMIAEDMAQKEPEDENEQK